MILRYTALSIIAAVILAGTAYWAHADESHMAMPTELAQAGPPPQGGPQGGPPPQAAFDACAELTEADACTFSLDGAEVTGTCHQPPEGRENALSCIPAGAGNG